MDEVNVWKDISFAHTRTTQGRANDKYCLDLYLPTLDKQTPLDSKINRIYSDKREYYNEDPAEHYRTVKSTNIQEKWRDKYGCTGRNIPLVIFLHGGGWRRGNRQCYRHFISVYDTNLLVALFMWFMEVYDNVGVAWARCGVPCALVSYPLIRLPLPQYFIELGTSTVMSYCLLLPLLLIPRIVLATVASTTCDLIYADCNQYLSQISIVRLLALSHVIMWLVITYHHHNYQISRICITMLNVLLLTLALLIYNG